MISFYLHHQNLENPSAVNFGFHMLYGKDGHIDSTQDALHSCVCFYCNIPYKCDKYSALLRTGSVSNPTVFCFFLHFQCYKTSKNSSENMSF